MICCDTCPFNPTCEEEDAELRGWLGCDGDWGEEYPEDSMADVIPDDWSGEAMT